MKLKVTIYLPGGGLGTDAVKIREELEKLDWVGQDQAMVVQHSAFVREGGYAEFVKELPTNYMPPNEIIQQSGAIRRIISEVYPRMDILTL